jgi:predicted DNA repair protein MutK
MRELRQSGIALQAHGPRMEKLGRFLLRGLRIGASTVSIVELLRNDWTGGITAGVAWLVFLQVEQRLPPTPQAPEE